MPIELYRVLHLLGILLVFLSLGGTALHALNGGTKETNRARKAATLTFAVGMVLVLVAGFGMLARLGHRMPPAWAFAKIGIWLVIGGMLTLPWRGPGSAKLVWYGAPLLGALAALLAAFKPF